MAKYDVYSQITNQLFYVVTGETVEGKKIYSEEGSILHSLGYDDKAIIILHELYVGSNYRRKFITTLDYLIEQCGYQVNKDSRKSFKNVLNNLKELKIINFENEIISGKMIEIDTEQLMLGSKEYFQIADEEIEIFKSISDLRLRTTLMKLYFYLKARVHKRGTSENTGETYDIQVEFQPQTTYQSYDIIHKYTNITEGRIKNYIDMLQEMNLITYRNFGKRYRINDTQQKLTECPNVYAVNNLQDDIEAELELGVKRCIKNQQEKGYVVVKKEYKNNDRKINGKKGSLIKKQKNNTINEEELKELNDIIAKENEYRETYNNFENEPKKEEVKPKGIGQNIKKRQDEEEKSSFDTEKKAREMRNRGINPFTNKPYENKEKHTTDKEYEDFIDSLL